MTDDDRIARLEARVATLATALEEHVTATETRERGAPGDHRPAPAAAPDPHVADPPPAGARTTVGDPGTFWALDGLKARLPEPGGVLFTGAVTLDDGRRAEWQEAFAAPDLLDGLDDDAAAALAAIAHPVRVLILRILLDGPRTVAELGEHERLGTSGQTYHHLRQLVGAGWLRTVARARYGVPPERVVPLLTAIAAVRR